MPMGKVWSPVAALGCAVLLFSQLVRAEDAPAKPGAAQTLPPAPGAIVPATPVKTGSGSPLDLSAACATPACPAPACPAPCPKCPLPCVYGSVEGLYWWFRPSSVVPLVTTNPDPNRIAALNEPGTTVLF